MLLSTSATMDDCRTFVTQVQQAQGRIPDVLANNRWPGTTLSTPQGASVTPRRPSSRLRWTAP